MKFDESYFKAEMVPGVYYEPKEGFYVEEKMKRAWAAQIEVLKVIEEICKRHGLTYYAEFGTLMGAVRHKGFIPWDDDVDITMKRHEYEQFLTYAMKELPEEFVCMTVYTEDDYKEMFARIVNSREISFSEERLEKFHGCPWVVGVDIFPMDYVSRNQEEVEVQSILVKVVSNAKLALQNGDADVEEKLKLVEEYCAVKLDREKPMVQQLVKLLDRLCALYHEEEGDELALMHNWIMWGTNRRKKEWYDEVVWLPFENTTISAPAGYMEVLQKMSGPAWKIPIRASEHEYPFYAGQEKLWEEHLRQMEIK